MGTKVEAEAGRNRENKKPEPVNVNGNYCKMDHRRWIQRWKQRQEVIEKIKNLNLSMLMLIIYCKMDHRRWEQRWRQRQEVIENVRNLHLSMLMLIIAKWIIGDGNKGGGRGRK